MYKRGKETQRSFAKTYFHENSIASTADINYLELETKKELETFPSNSKLRIDLNWKFYLGLCEGCHTPTRVALLGKQTNWRSSCEENWCLTWQGVLGLAEQKSL